MTSGPSTPVLAAVAALLLASCRSASALAPVEPCNVDEVLKRMWGVIKYANHPSTEIRFMYNTNTSLTLIHWRVSPAADSGSFVSEYQSLSGMLKPVITRGWFERRPAGLSVRLKRYPAAWVAAVEETDPKPGTREPVGVLAEAPTAETVDDVNVYAQLLADALGAADGAEAAIELRRGRITVCRLWTRRDGTGMGVGPDEHLPEVIADAVLSLARSHDRQIVSVWLRPVEDGGGSARWRVVEARESTDNDLQPGGDPCF